MTTPSSPSSYSTYTRSQFLARGGAALGSLVFLSSLKAETLTKPTPTAVAPTGFDLREFVTWITAQLEPSVRLGGGAGHYARQPGQKAMELYGVSDMACILYAIGALRPSDKERAEWAAAFQVFQNPESGWLIERSPTHAPLHNTAFALGAMQLLDLVPQHPVKMEARYANVRAFLQTLDWRKEVYHESHKGAGVGAIFALVPELNTSQWFSEYFATCDALFDSRNGLMGIDKPATGDSDQIGGTFHYAFLYEHFNRHMPFPEERIDTVIRLQQDDGYWMQSNHLWMTLDAIFLMTRTLRYCPHRFDDVQTVVRRVMGILAREVYSPAGRKKTFTGPLAVHLVTAAISIAAEAQRFLGAMEVVTEYPLRLVLDRRPFI